MHVTFYDLTKTLDSSRNFVRELGKTNVVTPRLVGIMLLTATASLLREATHRMFDVNIHENAVLTQPTVMRAFTDKYGRGTPFFEMLVAYANDPTLAPAPGRDAVGQTVGLFVVAPHTKDKPFKMAEIEPGAIGLKGHERLDLLRHLNQGLARAGL